MKPLLRKLPGPTGRLNFIQRSILDDLRRLVDENGIIKRSDLSPLLAGYLDPLISGGMIMLTDKHLAVVAVLSKALLHEKKRNWHRARDGKPQDWPVAAHAAELFPELAQPVLSPPIPPRLTRAQYLLLLARALQAEKVYPQTHSLLTYLATVRAEGKRATITSAMNALGCGYNAIIHHVSRAGGKHVHLFHVNRDVSPMGVEISADGCALLQRIDVLVQRYAIGG